ncbi:MAG: hypothetical protein V3S64_08475 [bacterium]
MPDQDTLIIDRRFHGPPNSGNGGYVAGRLAGRIAGTTEVTLRLPPPLEKELIIKKDGAGGVRLMDGDRLVAEARPVEMSLTVPDSPGLAAARKAVERFPGYEQHPFPTCFTCGHQREEGDGLRILSSPLEGTEAMAAPWVPHPSMADAAGEVLPEMLWAALDCPGAWPLVEGMLRRHFSAEAYMLLGRIAANLSSPVLSGQSCVTLGWPIGRDGRKLFSGSAIFAEDGTLIASAKATWLVMEPEQH